MKKSTTTLAAAVALAVVGVSLAGCTPASSSDGQTLSLMFDSTYRSAVEPIITAFEAENPDIKVKPTFVGAAEVGNVVPTQVQAGTIADVFIALPGPAGTSSWSVGTLSAQGALLSLSEEAWADDVPEVWSNSVATDGEVFAYPGVVQALGAMYNVTRLDELGLTAPTTFDEVLEFCAAAADAGVYAYSQALNDPAGPQMVDLALTATLVYGPEPQFTAKQIAGDATFADSGWKDAVSQYSEMNDAGCFGEGFAGRSRTQGIAEVAAGNALGVVDVGATLGALEEAAPDSEFVLTALPATDDPGDTYFPAAPGYVFVASAKADNPDAARKFISFVAQPAQINAYATALQNVPAIANDEFEPAPALADFTAAIEEERFVEFPGNDWPNPNVQVVHQDSISSLMVGATSIDGVLTAMDDAFAD